MNKTLEVRNLSKYYINKQGVNKAVDNVSFDLFEGEILGVMGQTGSGKSTIGKSILRLIDDINGTIVVDDKIISSPRITKQTQDILKANIQMISRDSSESLESRRNVYCILEESLNIKTDANDEAMKFWDNWNELATVFNYSAKIAYKTDLADLLNSKKNKITSYYESFNNFLDNYTFNPARSFKENTDIFLHERYTKKFNIYRELTDELIDHELKQFKNIDKLKTKFKNRELEQPLVDYINSIDNLNKYDIEAKRSGEYQYKLHQLNIVRNNEIKAFKRETHLNILAIKNDLKVREKFHKTLASNSTTFKTFETSLLREAAIKIQLKEINKIPKQVNALSANQLIELSNLISSQTIQTTKAMIAKLKVEQTNSSSAFVSSDTLKQFQMELEHARHNFEITNKNLEDEQVINQSKKEFDKAQQVFDAEADKVAKVEFKLKRKLAKKVISEITVGVTDYSKFIEYSKENIQLLRDKHTKIIQDEKNTEKNKPEFSNRIRRSLVVKINQAKAFKDELLQAEKPAFDSEKSALESEIKLLSTFFWTGDWNTKQKSIVNKFKSTLNKIIETAKESGVSKVELKRFKETIKEYEKRTMQYQVELETIAKHVDLFSNVFSLKNISNSKRTKIAKKIYCDKHIFSTLKEVGLSAIDAFKYPEELNRGNRLRVALARALMINPKIIVADEPAFGLDTTIQLQIISLLRQIIKSRNISMLYIGSDASMLEFIADNTLIMHLGKIIEFGESAQIFKKPAHIYTKTLLESIPKISNSSEEFKQLENINSYIHDYTISNQPKYHSITDEHFVFCTDEQLKKWDDENIVDILIKKSDNNAMIEDNITEIEFENIFSPEDFSLSSTVQINDGTLNKQLSDATHEIHISNHDIYTNALIDMDEMPSLTSEVKLGENNTIDGEVTLNNVEDSFVIDENIFQTQDENIQISESINSTISVDENPVVDDQIEFSDIAPLSTDEISTLQSDYSDSAEPSKPENLIVNDMDETAVSQIENNHEDNIELVDSDNEQENESIVAAPESDIVDSASGWTSEPIVEVVVENAIVDSPKPKKVDKANNDKKKKIVKKPVEPKKQPKETILEVEAGIIQQYVDATEVSEVIDYSAKQKKKTKLVEKKAKKSTAVNMGSGTKKSNEKAIKNKPTKQVIENEPIVNDLKPTAKPKNSVRIYGNSSEKIIIEKGMRMPKKVRDTKHEKFDLPQFKVDYENANKIIESTFVENAIIEDTEAFENDIEEIQVIKSANAPSRTSIKPPRPNRGAIPIRNREAGKVDGNSKATLNLDGYFIDKDKK